MVFLVVIVVVYYFVSFDPFVNLIGVHHLLIFSVDIIGVYDFVVFSVDPFFILYLS